MRASDEAANAEQDKSFGFIWWLVTQACDDCRKQLSRIFLLSNAWNSWTSQWDCPREATSGGYEDAEFGTCHWDFGWWCQDWTLTEFVELSKDKDRNTNDQDARIYCCVWNLFRFFIGFAMQKSLTIHLVSFGAKSWLSLLLPHCLAKIDRVSFGIMTAEDVGRNSQFFGLGFGLPLQDLNRALEADPNMPLSRGEKMGMGIARHLTGWWFTTRNCPDVGFVQYHISFLSHAQIWTTFGREIMKLGQLALRQTGHSICASAIFGKNLWSQGCFWYVSPNFLFVYLLIVNNLNSAIQLFSPLSTIKQSIVCPCSSSLWDWERCAITDEWVWHPDGSWP